MVLLLQFLNGTHSHVLLMPHALFACRTATHSTLSELRCIALGKLLSRLVAVCWIRVLEVERGVDYPGRVYGIDCFGVDFSIPSQSLES